MKGYQKNPHCVGRNIMEICDDDEIAKKRQEYIKGQQRSQLQFAAIKRIKELVAANKQEDEIIGILTEEFPDLKSEINSIYKIKIKNFQNERESDGR